MIRALFATIALLCLLSPASARHAHMAACIETGTAMQPVCGMAPSSAGNGFLAGVRSIRIEMHRDRRARARHVPVAAHGSPTVTWAAASDDLSAAPKPYRFIAGRLVCARNVNSALAERGVTGTGSALALSFRHWGHSAGGPVPGAVIVSARRGGGHVALVSRVRNGVVYAWNPSGRVGWKEIPYRHRVLDYRVPG